MVIPDYSTVSGQLLPSIMIIFISHFSPQASWCDVYAFMVATMKKSGKLQLEYRILLSFVITKCGNNFRFSITWSHARHLAVNDVATSGR